MPLLTDLSSWRTKLTEIERRFEKDHRDYDLTFVADFSGLKLENYISIYLNTTIEVLNGLVNVEFDTKSENERGILVYKKTNVTLGPGERLNVPSGAFHNVFTISEEPSCFFYIYINETALEVSKLYERFLINMMNEYNKTYENLNQHYNGTTDEENIIWKAFNLTMIRNSNEFMHMISFNESKSDLENEEETKRIQTTFEKPNLNYIYNLFSQYFRNHVKQRLFNDKLGLFEKLVKQLWQNFLKFKQR